MKKYKIKYYKLIINIYFFLLFLIYILLVKYFYFLIEISFFFARKRSVYRWLEQGGWCPQELCYK